MRWPDRLITDSYSGKGLGTTWTLHDKRSAFVGSILNAVRFSFSSAPKQARTISLLRPQTPSQGYAPKNCCPSRAGPCSNRSSRTQGGDDGAVHRCCRGRCGKRKLLRRRATASPSTTAQPLTFGLLPEFKPATKLARMRRILLHRRCSSALFILRKTPAIPAVTPFPPALTICVTSCSRTMAMIPHFAYS